MAGPLQGRPQLLTAPCVVPRLPMGVTDPRYDDARDHRPGLLQLPAQLQEWLAREHSLVIPSHN